jgi:hypothetical protein
VERAHRYTPMWLGHCRWSGDLTGLACRGAWRSFSATVEEQMYDAEWTKKGKMRDTLEWILRAGHPDEPEYSVNTSPCHPVSSGDWD